MTNPAIRFPTSYVSCHALAIADTDGSALLITAAAPLPVNTASATTPALAGSSGTSALVGPFTPVTGRSVILALSGDWSGSVQVTRSTDGGVTRLPLTIGGGVWGVFSVNCCEAVWDESEINAQLYLEITLTSGTVNYRLAQ